MAEFPGFTIWTDAYLADTSHLTMAEHGGYLKLLMAMWRSGGFLPNDDKKLARFASATEKEWAKVKPALMEFFTVVDGQITQGRLQDELEKARSRSKQASKNARSKYRKSLNEGDAGASSPHSETGSETPASISISTSIEEKKPSVSKKGTRIPADFQPDLDAAVTLGLRPEVAMVEAAKFKDYWIAASGAKGVKLDWPATWRNWVRSALQRQGARGSPGGKSAYRQHQDDVKRELENFLDGKRTQPEDSEPFLDLGREDFFRD